MNVTWQFKCSELHSMPLWHGHFFFSFEMVSLYICKPGCSPNWWSPLFRPLGAGVLVYATSSKTRVLVGVFPFLCCCVTRIPHRCTDTFFLFFLFFPFFPSHLHSPPPPLSNYLVNVHPWAKEQNTFLKIRILEMVMWVKKKNPSNFWGWGWGCPIKVQRDKKGSGMCEG